MHNWFIYDEFDDASKAAADFLAIQIDESIKQNNVCHVVLPGGNSPAACLGYLSAKKLPWDKIHWYLGDERCHPSGHPDRNDVMLQNNLWSHIPQEFNKDSNVHRIPAELGAQVAARLYSDIIRPIKNFDIVFLGMGEDGHTASLFPENEALQDKHAAVPVYNSPKPPGDRVSLSVDTLKKAKCRMVLTGGATKAEILKRVKQGECLPINCVGDINWYVDESALPASENK